MHPTSSVARLSARRIRAAGAGDASSSARVKITAGDMNRLSAGRGVFGRCRRRSRFGTSVTCPSPSPSAKFFMVIRVIITNEEALRARPLFIRQVYQTIGVACATHRLHPMPVSD